MNDDDVFAEGSVLLTCPHCSATVDYNHVLPTDANGMSKCPSCQHEGPTSEWFEPADWLALCDACQYVMPESDYKAAEAAAGPSNDPRCPSCSRSIWSFHRKDFS